MVFFSYLRLSNNSITEYYQKSKEWLQNKARERHQNLSKEEKKVTI